MSKIPTALWTLSTETWGPVGPASRSPVSRLTAEQPGNACAGATPVPGHTGVSGGKISIITFPTEKQKTGCLEGLRGPSVFYSN